MTPPGGWRDVEPTTGVACQACCFAELVSAEMRALIANKKPIPQDLADQVDGRIAEHLQSVWVYDVDAPTAPVHVDSRKIHVSLKSVQDKTSKLIAAWRKVGSLRCTQEEANARAKTCLSCQYNVPAGCLSCAGVFRWLETQVGMRLSTPFDRRLHVCSVDQVFGKINVWLHQKIFKAMIPAGSRPLTGRYSETCWKKAILEAAFPAPVVQTPTPIADSVEPTVSEHETPVQVPSAPETVREPEPVQTVPVETPIRKEGASLPPPAPIQLIGQGVKRPRGRPRKIRTEA
jgi:hypothetical protein